MFNLRIKTIPVILCLGGFSVIAFYIWSTSYDPYGSPSIDKLQSDYTNALNDPQYYFEKAKHYVDLARQDLAVPDYSKAIELDPENVFYYWERGRAYWVMSQYQKSLDDYDKAIELEIPQGLERKAKVTNISYELDKLQEERKELLKDIN